jgi:1-acyl-sn-glycerol-3-phosphate acyltransferase
VIVGTAYRNPISFLGRKSLFRGVAAWLFPRVNCLPIDQQGSDIGGLKSVIRELKAGRRIVLFPEGSRSADGALQPGEPGIGFIISKAGVPVQPVRIFGAHEALPRGARVPRLSRIRLVVGEPLHLSGSPSSARSRDLYQQISDRVMREIAALRVPDDL